MPIFCTLINFICFFVNTPFFAKNVFDCVGLNENFTSLSRYFSRVATWKQEIANFQKKKNHSEETLVRTPDQLPHKSNTYS